MTTVIGHVVQELEVGAKAERGRSARALWTTTMRDARRDGRLDALRGLSLQSTDFEADEAFETFLSFAIEGIRAHGPASPRGDRAPRSAAKRRSARRRP